MNARDEVHELSSLLRSRFPIILIASHEEPRILELLNKVCNLENQVLMSWSITSGIRRYGRDEAIYQTNDLLDALKHIDKTPQNGVYVLCDAHPGFKDPVSMRLIREIALAHYKSARTLVFISPRLDDLPSEILRLSAHFRPTLPDREAIRAIVSAEAKRHEQQTGEKARGDRHALEMLIMHLLGMEQDDVRRLVRQALRDDGAINADDVRRVARVRPVRLVRLHRQHLEHPLHRRQRPLQFGEGIDQVPDRAEQEKRVPLEGHDVAGGRAALDVEVSPVPYDHDVDAGLEQTPRRPQDCLASLGEHLFPQHGVAAHHVVDEFPHLAPERPDDANARKRLPHAAVDLFRVLPHRAVDRPDAPGEHEAHQHDGRNDRERRQRQPPVQRQQHGDRNHQADDGNRRRNEGHLQQAGGRVHVSGQA